MDRLRMRLAQMLAPPGADVHDPDATACPSELTILKAVEAYDLYPDPDARVRLDVTTMAKDAEGAGWIQVVTDYNDNPVYQLTAEGEAQLRQRREAATR